MEYTWIIAWAEGNGAPSQVNDLPLEGQGQDQTTSQTQAPPDPNQTGAPSGPQFPTQLIFLAVIFVIMYVFMLRGPRKQQQKHKQMVQALAKNDRVRTIGGILGTVVDIKGDEVTLKIDESNNTKIKVTTSAIGRNLTQEGGKE
ncbi:MAG: preprotein translocase subunit YajC [Sedimentisphaerales bacterium]|nr:preprotein translocase subunit YajC [Sedimentisphaerales bacterium]